MTASIDPGCIFCRIIAGSAPDSKIYEDERAIAFMDLYPVVPGHVLVIPRAHSADLAGLDADDAAHLMRVGKRVAAALRASDLRCEGVNLYLADGEAAGQDVFHVHLHVIPRFPGDGVRFVASRGRPSRAELDAQSRRIRAAFK